MVVSKTLLKLMGILPEEAEAQEPSAIRALMRPQSLPPEEIAKKYNILQPLTFEKPKAEVRMSGGNPKYWEEQKREKERAAAEANDPEYQRRLAAIAKSEADEKTKKAAMILVRKQRLAKEAAEQAEQQAMFDASTGKKEAVAPVAQKQVPEFNGEPNLAEAMNPTTGSNARERIKAASLAPGAKESLSISSNNYRSEAQNAADIQKVLDARDAFEVDAFDRYQTIPSLNKLKEQYEKELQGYEGQEDATIPILKTLAAIGYDPTKTDISGFYKNDSKDKANALRDKIRAIVNDQSKAMGDNSKFLSALYANQRAPNTNFATSAGNAPLPRAGSGGAGAGKPPTNNELKDYGEGYGKILKIKSQEKRLMQIADGVDQDVLKAYSISAPGASALNTVKGLNPFSKGSSGKSAVTEEALSILADIMMNYQLELSGKAATDKEAAKIMLASGISLGASQGGTKQGIANVLNDFKRQLALPLAGRKTTLKQMFDEESGLDSTNDVKSILQGVQGDRIQQVAPSGEPSAGGSGMSPEARRARIQELKAKKAAGTIK